MLLAGLSLALLAGSSGCGPADGTEESDLGQVVQPVNEVQHVLVHHEPGTFAAFPANHGIRSWGNVILVGFERSEYDPDPAPNFHHTTGNRREFSFQARSLDGGEHWAIERHDELDDLLSPEEDPPTTGKMPLQWHDRFAMKLYHDSYWMSETRGVTWRGPYAVPDFGQDALSGRTAMVRVPPPVPPAPPRPEKTLLFMSVMNGDPNKFAFDGLLDPDAGPDAERRPARPDDVARTMVFSTQDAGRTFQNVNWVAPRPRTCSSIGCPVLFNYSIMPSVIVHNGKIVVALRERASSESRIKIVASSDEGATWTSLSIPVSSQDGQGEEGPNNPGSLVHLPQGKLGLVYADRRNRMVWARVSSTGATWGAPIPLTTAAWNEDMGYVQAVTRPDGKVVVVYYFTTPERQEQHIRATIWTPPGWAPPTP